MKTKRAAGRRRVVIYCRISDDREGRRWGVDRQERVCRERAEDNGWDVVAVLTDNDISAYSGKKRPGYAQLLAMLEQDQADAVLALSNRRLSRRIAESLPFLDLVKRLDIRVDTIKAGAWNLNTAEGWTAAHHAAVDAQGESMEIGERVRDAKADNVARGEFRGGPRPFGYEANGMIPKTLQCPGCAAPGGFRLDRTCRGCGAAAVNAPGSEAWWADWATDQVLARRSIRSITAELGRAGVLTVPRRRRDAEGNRTEPMAQPWAETELRRMLLRPRNAGLLEVGGEVAGRAAWPPIVAEDKWRACVALLTAPGRRTTTGNARKWLGSGLYLCGTEGCAETMRCTTSGRGSGKEHVVAYRCRSGKHVTRTAAPLDAFVERVAVARLARADAVDLLRPQEPEDSRDRRAEADALRAKLDGYVADYDDDLITRQQMIDGTARTRARLKALEMEMGTRAAPPVLAGVPLGRPEVKDAWDGYDLGRKRAIIGALFTVTVLPAKRGRPAGFKPGSGEGYFDPEAVRIDWK